MLHIICHMSEGQKMLRNPLFAAAKTKKKGGGGKKNAIVNGSGKKILVQLSASVERFG